MHAGLLDVLHDAADQHVLAVAHRIDVDLGCHVQEAIQQHGTVIGDLHRLGHVDAQVVLVEHDLHRAAAEHVGRAHDQRIADLAGEQHGLVLMTRGRIRRLLEPEPRDQLLEALAVLGHVDRVRARADDRHAQRRQRLGQLQRRLAAVLHDDAGRLFLEHDLQHVLKRQWLEVQPVGGIVVGGDRLRVAVDHDGFDAILAQCERCVDAAVVELDALADPVRTAAEDHDLAPLARLRLALLLVGRIQVGGVAGELGRARIHALVHRMQPVGMPALAHDRLLQAEQVRDATVGEALALERAQPRRTQCGESAGLDQGLLAQQVADLRQKPRVDARELVDALLGPAGTKRVADEQQPVRARVAQLLGKRGRRLLGQRQVDLSREAVEAVLKAPERLLQRLLEGPADRHRLADRLHLRRQVAVGARKLLEGEARDLRDDVVDRRLERRRRRATGDVVLQFVERVADRELGRDLGDREPGGLGGKRRGARHARIHLDDQHAAVLRAYRELHVRAAGIHADLAQHRDRRITQPLVLAVGQRLRRRDGDRIAGVDTHRVEVLDRAHDDAVVRVIANDLHLVFFPAEHRLLEQHLRGWRGVQTARDDLLEFLAVVGDAAAAAAHRERRADHGREADLGLHRERFLKTVSDARARRIQPDVGHRVAELLAVFGHVDRFARRADQFAAELLEHAFAHQVERAVERRLPAHRRQHRVGPLLLDDPRDGAPVHGLDVHRIGHVRVGHDRGRVRVDQHHAIALLAQCLAGLRAGVIELAGLTDHDRTRADDQDALDVSTLWHSTRSCAAR